MLKFRVCGQKLTWENPDEVVVAGTKKYLECYFEFDGDEWSGFKHIDVFFKNGRDKPVQMVLSGNRIRKEDGLCLTAGDWAVYLCATTYNDDGVEIDKQMTSSSVSIRVLAHGQLENAQNSFESPEIANQYIAQMLDAEKGEAARNVFEEYDSEKEYVRGNKVAFEGSSYVLVAESALGINPTDTEVWLCIAEAGSRYFGFPYIEISVGNDDVLTFDWDVDDKEKYPGVDEWRIGDMLLSENGKIMRILKANKSEFSAIAVVLCIADIKGPVGDKGDTGEKGDKGDKGDTGEHGTKWFSFGEVFEGAIGEKKLISFQWDIGEDGNNIEDFPGIEDWRIGDMLLSENGKVLELVNVIKAGSVVRLAEVLCVADIKGPRGESVLIFDDYGNVTYGDNRVGCMAYYIKSIDLEGKKIYLSESKVTPVISTEDNTDTDFETPDYDVGDGFSIVNKNHYNNCGTIASVVNNVVTYSEDSLGFAAINEDTDGGIADYTFRVYNKPDIGVVAVTKYAFAVGSDNKALGSCSSAEGGGNVADGFYSHVEGLNNYAAYGAHAEGNGNKAIGNESHVEGHSTTATGGNAHAEGQNTIAKGGGSHAEGMGTQAVGSQSHSEGLNTVAKSAQSHAEGVGTQANAFCSHAEGNGSIASGSQSHAEGYQTKASGTSSHAEGQQTEAANSFAHAQGIRSYAKGYAAFTSGADVEASGDVSVAMGKNAKATGRASMAVGEDVNADAYYAMALGRGVSAKEQGQIAVGMYNADDSDAVFIVGGGTASARKNVFAVKKDGRIFVNGVEFTGGTSGAMVFKGVVDALPTSVNENDVYVLKGAKLTTVTFDGLYDYPTVTSTRIYIHGGFEVHEWLNKIVDDIGFVNGGNIYISVNGNCYVLKNASVSYDYDSGDYTANIYYSQNDEIVQALDGADSFVASANPPDGTYIYHNGEWVEL